MEKDEITKETDILPEDEATKPDAKPEPTAEDRVRELEIENARMKGREEARKVETAAPQPNRDEAWKGAVMNDVNALSDEDFRTKYKCEKFQATGAIVEHELKKSTDEQKRQVAELRAENQMVSRYGQDFAKFQEEVNEAIADASPEVRQDPARLAKVMERAYLAASKETGGDKTKGEPVERKRISSGFERPAAGGERKIEPKKKEIAAEFQGLSRAFGIESEEERVRLLESPLCEVDLGGGKVFRESGRVETVAK